MSLKNEEGLFLSLVSTLNTDGKSSKIRAYFAEQAPNMRELRP